MARMTSAFCCLSLRTSSIIIGWFTLTVAAAVLTFGLTRVGPRLDELEDSKGVTDFDVKVIGIARRTFYLYLCVGVAIAAFVSFTLLHGISQQRREFLLPYVHVSTLAIACIISSMFYSYCWGDFSTQSMVARFILIVISFYFVLIVRSYYQELNPENHLTRSSTPFKKMPA